MTSCAGCLVLVVGPSGSGKDTLLGGARRLLGPASGFLFARRAITRPADAGGEAHRAVSEAEFDAMETAGGFALSWRAHGLSYGIEASVAAAITVGTIVVANVSRQVIAAAAARFPVHVIEITASPATRAGRLASRGRESAPDIAARLTRTACIPAEVPQLMVVNDGTVEHGVAAVVRALLDVQGSIGTPSTTQIYNNNGMDLTGRNL